MLKNGKHSVKILTHYLKRVLNNSRVGRYVADTWKSRTAAPSPVLATVHSSAPTPPYNPLSLKLTSWNCRGLSSSLPYLNTLISDGSDITVLSEHWLWPFDLHRLNEIHPDYRGHGQSDSRLTSRSEGRGLGGVGIIWRQDLDVSVIHATTSDHICSIRLSDESSGSTLTVVGVYLPCQDLGMDLYRGCLSDLERLVCESRQLGPTVVMGDFNAHLGSLGGLKGCGNQGGRKQIQSGEANISQENLIDIYK